MARKIKKYLGFFSLIILVLFSLSTPAFADGFSDVQGHWAQAYINALAQASIISGYPDGTFRPDSQITRAEFSTILVKGLRLQIKTPGASSFSDVSPSDWYFSIVETAAAAGLVKGYDGRFWPNTPITREQIVTMLVRALNLGAQAEARHNDPIPFRDAASISSWARGYVLLGKELGLIGGYPDGSFRGSNCATRAEAAVMLVKFLQTYMARAQDPPELLKASYDVKSAKLELTFDEEIKVNNTDITKIGFQFNNENSVYFMTNSSKIATAEANSRVLEIIVVGMPDLSKVTSLYVWLKAGAVVDLDGVPNQLCKAAVEFSAVAALPQQEQAAEPSPLPELLPATTESLGDLIQQTLDSVTTPLSPLLNSATAPIGDLLNTVTGTVGSLPVIGGVLDTAGNLLNPLTDAVSGVTGTALNTLENLPLVGSAVSSVTEPVKEATKDIPLVGDLASSNHENTSDSSLLQPITGVLEGLTGTVLNIVRSLPLLGG